MPTKKKAVKKKVVKKTRKELQEQTKENMKNARMEDIVNLRKKALNLISGIKNDIEIIEKAKVNLKQQLRSLEAKEIKSLGALSILNMLLEEDK